MVKKRDILKLLAEKLKELNALKSKAEKSLEKAPEGSLILSSSNGTTQYYHKTNPGQKKGKYIPKEHIKMISALAQKDYDIVFLRVVNKEIKSINKILKSISATEAIEVYERLSEGRKNVVKPHILTDVQYAEKWQSVKYCGKEFSEDMPMILTEKGERVRSKTEKIIADKLYAMNIPYRYEYPIKLKGYGTVYPDFTLLNPVTREEICLEHFGMMDSASYSEKAIRKIEDYIKSGFYLGKNFLVTFETSRYPLNMNVFEKMIKEAMEN